MDALIVDDHPVMHELLGGVVRKAYGSVDVRHANTLDGALKAGADCADLGLVMLDLGLPGCTELDALRAMAGRFPQPKIVIFSAIESPSTIRRALTLGASGYIPKTSRPAIILAALRLVAAGGRYVPPEVLNGEDHSDGNLTPRQLEVLMLMAKGHSNRAIATALRISEITVKQHATDIYQALRVSGREQAIAVAKQLPPPR